MREIKFRAWVNSNVPRMAKWEELLDWKMMNHLGNPFENPDYTLMQYTGLKDKNGREIYEDDMVRVLHSGWISKDDSDPRTLDEYLRDIAKVGKVEFNPSYGWFVYPGSLDVGPHGFVEIIGNIHENPELLK